MVVGDAREERPRGGGRPDEAAERWCRGIKFGRRTHPFCTISSSHAGVAVAHGAVVAGTVERADRECSAQKLILGTHTSEHEQTIS